MNRLLLAAGVALLLAVAAGPAVADIAPPKGFKRVALDNKITTEKEFPDYVFYTVIGGAGKGGGFKENANAAANARGVNAVKFDPKTPIEIKAEGRGAGIGRQGSLVAVPKDARKKYASDEEFHAAIRLGKVEGALRAKVNFDSATTVKDTDARTTVTQEYKLEKIDPKDGLVITRVKGEEKKDEPKKDGKPEEEEEGVAAYAPKGGVWVAALAATAGLVLGGLWLAGRRRRAGE